MRRVLLPVVVLAALVVPSAAQGGDAIATLPACAHSYYFFDEPTSAPANFRSGLLCLINGARKAEGLPALKRSAALERVGQTRAKLFVKSGHHKVSTTALFAEQGYRAAVSGEGPQFLNLDAPTPYNTLVQLVAHHGSPCSTILDPRIRDIGIGVAYRNGPPVTAYAALEVGLKSGVRPASTKTGPAKGCPHTVPKPLLTRDELAGTSAGPVVSATTITITIRCAARATCVFDATPSLIDAHATGSTAHETIAAGATKALTFTFPASAIQTELSAGEPEISVDAKVTAPGEYDDTIQEDLPTH